MPWRFRNTSPGGPTSTGSKELITHPGLEERAEHTTHILTEPTRNVSIVAAIRRAQTLAKVELVWLERVLMVVVTGDGLVRNQVAQLNHRWRRANWSRSELPERGVHRLDADRDPA
jgi:transcriptional regulator of heat shock response